MRQIPFMTQIKILLNGTLTMLGVAIMVIGIFLSLFTVTPQSFKPLFFIGGKTEAVAKITTVLDVEGSKTIKRFLYTYQADKQAFTGTSYTKKEVTVGDMIEIEYLKNNPKKSLLKGAKVNTGALPPILLTISGAVLFLMFFGKNVHTWLLIRSGHLTRGKLVAKEKTEKGTFNLEFQYNDRKGNVYHIQKKGVEIEDGIPSLVLYLPKKPTVSMLVENIPDEVHLYDI